MSRFFALFVAALVALNTVDAFTVSRTTPARPSVVTRMSEDDQAPVTPTVERGVSVDQDGKSNVWAIEPKVELDGRSSDEKMGSALIGVGGFAAFAAVAGIILTNLPDPNQF
jgi:hypothetical protein